VLTTEIDTLKFSGRWGRTLVAAYADSGKSNHGAIVIQDQKVWTRPLGDSLSPFFPCRDRLVDLESIEEILRDLSHVALLPRPHVNLGDGSNIKRG
jgi:hypothetical protein